MGSSFVCTCGKTHVSLVDQVLVGKGVIGQLPEIVKRYQAKRVFLLADLNTYKAAGERVAALLSEAQIAYSQYVFEESHLEPDEAAVGSAVMHFDQSCDLVIGIGSGVINDIGKIVSSMADLPYMIVGTAPSMDGYASATSSMSLDGLKVSLPSKCANVIIGDIDFLKTAPDQMLIAGLGDMLAKYISICEWRIAHLLVGEYYCETIAQMIREALAKCVQNAGGLLKREDEAIAAVFEGLVKGGEAMMYAGLSRPASGIEHYFSHIWDMRGLAFHTPVALHGLQCAVGTLLSARIYEQLKQVKPDEQRALAYVEHFDTAAWQEALGALVGKGAKSMIALEVKEGKYDQQKHAQRLKKIVRLWPEILQIIEEEVPSSQEIEKVLKTIHGPLSAGEVGQEEALLPQVFQATKDIRDKYIASRLAWDLGIIDEIKLG